MTSLSSLRIIQDFIPRGRRNRPGTHIRPTFITIHNTDNTDPGADAAAHARFAKAGAGEGSNIRSWHYTVDDKVIYQHLPIDELGYHAFANANASSIGIEICMYRGMAAPAAYDRAAQLAAALLGELGLNSSSKLKQHHDWTGKNCPSVLRGRANGWRDFLAAVDAHLQRADSAAATFSTEAAEAAHGSDIVRVHTGVELAAAAQAKPTPSNGPVPFAKSSAPTRYWPVITKHPQALLVSANLTNGSSQGRPGRQFFADRLGGRRHHIGLDIFCYEGDEVVAIEDGKVVNFYAFYKTSAGEMSYALLVAHDGYVANYGEVKENSLRAYGLSVGSTVRAGQKIGRVSSTVMIHFETWEPGTKKSSRWMSDSARPRGLLNPTQLLLDLSETAIRLDVDGIALATAPVREVAVTAGRRRRIAAAATTQALSDPSYPQPGSSDWHNKFGGKEWRYDHRGVYVRDHQNGSVPLRWELDLVTMRLIQHHMFDHVLAMSRKHKINPALIMMTIATETHFQARAAFTGPGTFRWEPDPSNDDVPSPFKGTYSAGPMQTLATTMRELIVARGKAFDLNYEPFKVAPAIKKKPTTKPAKHPLYDYATNLDLGTAEIRSRLSKTGDDPILVAAAFNAGSLKASDANDWNIRSHGDHLDRASKWYGDACALLVEVGIF